MVYKILMLPVNVLVLSFLMVVVVSTMLAFYRSAVAGLIAPLLQTITDSSRYGTSTGYEPRYYLLDQHSYNWSDIATQSDLQSVVSLTYSEYVLWVFPPHTGSRHNPLVCTLLHS